MTVRVPWVGRVGLVFCPARGGNVFVRLSRVPFAAALSAVPLVAVLAVAGSGEATTAPDTVVETSVAASDAASVELFRPTNRGPELSR